ncbi:MAG: serine acetyltransferase [Deltaproteobacteria bacterium]|nr:serine acetyltransferase [Deltaproteobacteria bacterium]
MIRSLLFRITRVFSILFYLLKFRNVWRLKAFLENQSQPNRTLLALYESLLAKTGSWIGYNAKFKGIPCFPHGLYGVFISGGATIGKNVIIFQQVTIGSNTLNDSKNIGSPVIGDNVYIGAGAKLIGDIRIGDNCRIGANAVVYKSLPPHSVAVQSPTKIIAKNSLDNRYYSRKGDKWVFYNDGKWVVDESKQI